MNISSLSIPYDKLLLRLGYLQAKTKIDEKTELLIKESLDAAQKLIRPKAVIACANIQINDNLITFEDGYKIESFDVAKLLEGCFKAYGIAVTVGNALERKRDDFILKKETFKALVFDAAGSVAAEETITAVNEQLKQIEEKNNNKMTKRYSPGYGDWILESQKDFLNWLGSKQIGLTLTAAFHMSPEKSVSAIAGVKRQ